MPRNYRRVSATEVPYVLRDDRALPEAEQARWVLAVPPNTVFAEFCDEFLGHPNGSNVAAVERFLVRMENHPDGSSCGAAGSPARSAYVGTLAFGVVRELSNEISRIAMLTETERKNSDSPSASSPTTGGTDAAAGSASPPTP
jgi:hypothetical protein